MGKGIQTWPELTPEESEELDKLCNRLPMATAEEEEALRKRIEQLYDKLPKETFVWTCFICQKTMTEVRRRGSSPYQAPSQWTRCALCGKEYVCPECWDKAGKKVVICSTCEKEYERARKQQHDCCRKRGFFRKQFGVAIFEALDKGDLRRALDIAEGGCDKFIVRCDAIIGCPARLAIVDYVDRVMKQDSGEGSRYQEWLHGSSRGKLLGQWLSGHPW